MLYPRAVPLRLRHLLPGARRAPLRGQVDRVPRLPGRDYLFEQADWWINQVRAVADFYLRGQFPDGNYDWRNYRTKLTLAGTHTPDYIAPDFRQETDTISRLVYGFATAYLLTGEDRFLEAAETGTEYLRDHMRGGRRGRGHRLLVPRRRHLARRPAQDPRLGVRRRLRRHPDVRADLRARRPDADLPRHGRPAHPRRHRARPSPCSTGSSATASRVATSRTSTRSRSTRARDSSAHNRARKNWNSVGDHAPALPDQRAAGHRPQGPRGLPGRTPATRSSRTSPTTTTARSCRSGSTRTGRHDRHVGLAAEPRRRRPQPEDRLEPDAHQQRPAQRRATSSWRKKIAEIMPAGRQRPAARRLVRRDGARRSSPARSGTASCGTTARRGGSRSRRSSPT